MPSESRDVQATRAASNGRKLAHTMLDHRQCTRSEHPDIYGDARLASSIACAHSRPDRVDPR